MLSKRLVLFDRTAQDTVPQDRLIDSREVLAEIDANIVRHWRQIAARRTRKSQEAFPTYFQWLSLLGTELYLRSYIAERRKTLLMHVSLLQFRYYISRFPRQAPQIDQVILVTPNERLSEQYLAEWAQSGVQAPRFASAGGAFEMFRGIEPPLWLESFIVSTTPFENVMWNTHAGDARRTKTEFEDRHVLFMGDGNYVGKMMETLVLTHSGGSRK